jgi:ABC-type Mn2+/Zn2+ transport system permease subunit
LLGLTLCLFAAAAAARGAVTPLATELAADTVTQDIEREIQTAAAGPKPDAETEARLRAPRGEEDPTPKTWDDWVRLIRLLWPAIVTAAAVGIASSIAGVFVMLRREALLALAIPQVVAIGAALAMRLEWPTLPPALVAAAVGLVLLAFARRRGLGNWLLPSLYIAGLSCSFLIIANHGQDVSDLQKLFTGIDVAVSPERAAAAAPILLITGLFIALLWRRWLLLAQAPASAELAGVRPAWWDATFLALLTLVLLLGTDSQGVVMVLAMLFLPAAAVLPWARRIPTALAASAVLALAFLVAGFWLSNTQKWPMSQSVGGAGFAVMLLSNAAAFLKRN